MSNENKDYYSDTAYNSSDIKPQPKAAKKGVLQKMLSIGHQRFQHFQTDSSVSSKLLREESPSEWKELHSNKKKEPYWNHESLLSYSFGITFFIYLNISAIAKVTAVYITSLLIFTFILSYIVTFGGFGWSYMVLVGTAYIQFVLIPCLLIWAQFELFNHGYWTPWFLKVRKQFELNRRTGMVTLYKRGNRIRFSHPFIEFDCILVSVPNHQGLLSYSLVLAHRYNGSKFGVPIGNLIGNQEMVAEYQRLWNVIQRYMDISQPLPDTLILEASRSKDPTTAAFDQKTGRDPRYWRDMDDKEFEKVVSKICNKQTWSKKRVGGAPLDIFQSQESGKVEGKL